MKPVRLLGLLLAVAASAASTDNRVQAAAPEASAPRYNVIYILLDDLRYDGMGFVNPQVKTPNIDFLAKNGVYFPNAVVTSSLCSPSRATILTGQSARNHGVISNQSASEDGLVFFPAYLQKAGYSTAFFGKWHMGDATDAPRPGFDHWVSFKGQGTYLPTQGLSDAELAAGKRQTLNVDGRRVERRGYITEELTDYTLEWLTRGREANKPFFVYLSHKAVHSEVTTTAAYRRQYEDTDFALPGAYSDDDNRGAGKPVWVRNQRNTWHGVEFPYNRASSMAESVREYYRTLSPVDDSIGRILKWLKASGLDRNTMVVFNSDNGFLIGEHGLIDKRNAYEPSIRVPLIVYAPGLVSRGVTNPSRVRNLDFAPTMLEMAGVEKPSQMEGTSWLPLALDRDPTGVWRPGDFIYEYYWEWRFPQTPTTFAIERDGFKYIQYHGVYDIEELYDLKRDPAELNNLVTAAEQRERLVELRTALFEQLANRAGRHVVPYTQIRGAGNVLRDASGTRAADFPEHWYVTPGEARGDPLPNGPPGGLED